MRFLRLACSSCGLARSFLVIDWISAIWLLQDLVVHPGGCDLFGHFPMPGIMPMHAFHAAHLHHLFELRLQIVHVELTLLEALHHALGLLGLDGLLRLFDQRNDVAHAEDTAGDAFGLEVPPARPVFSPKPTNLIGLPVTARIDSAAPPRPSPSIRVRTRP